MYINMYAALDRAEGRHDGHGKGTYTFIYIDI